jgi:opacity protein-like surface antigen
MLRFLEMQPHRALRAAMNAPLAGAIGQKTLLNKPLQADPDDIAHQALATDIQGRGFVNILGERDVTEEMKLAVKTSPANSYSNPDSTQNKDQTLVAMSETDDLSHQALATVMREQDKDTFYFVKTSGAVPLFDKDFRDFIDYGLGVSVGAGKKLNDNLSLSVAFDMVLLTGDWSQKGDRESLIFGEARYSTDRPGEPSQPVITIEAEESISSEANTGIGYIEGAEAQIINAESLKSIDIHTDMYLFPVSINALYKFNKIGKISPYLGGGLGYCLAVRDSDSKALKSRYWDGPDYGLHFNNSQTSNGMLLKLLGGLNIPVYKNMLFVAEANTTMYDLKKFDPILEVSFTKPSNPTCIGGNDVSTWSYEDPKQFGVFDQSIVANFSIGFVMPF